MITHEQVMAALSQVQEPDLGKDLVTLNMVKDVAIDGKQVNHTGLSTERYDSRRLRKCRKVIGR